MRAALRTATPQVVGDLMTSYKGLRLKGFSHARTLKEIAYVTGKPESEIWAIVKHFTPTTTLAQDYFRAQAFRMAVRTVRKANVAECIDVLSRPNIGVLAPKSDGGGGQGGFFLSVSAETCGAVKIGVAANLPQSPAPDQDQFGLSWESGGLSSLIQESLNEYDQQQDRADSEARDHKSGESDAALTAEPDRPATRPDPPVESIERPEPQQPSLKSRTVRTLIQQRERLEALQSQRRREWDERAAFEAYQESQKARDAGTGDVQ